LQATLTRSLETATATRTLPTNTLPLATPIVTPRPSPPLFPTVAPSPTVGSFGAIIFAPGVMGSGSSTKPVDPATRFPEGLARVFTLFSSGTYELKLYIDDRLVQLGTFVIQK